MSGVRLPSAVKRQGEAADAELARLQNPQRGTDDPSQYVGAGEPAADPGITEPPVSDPPQAAAPTATPVPGDGQPPATPPSKPGDFDWEAEAKALTEERDKLAQRLRTLQGKYDAEVPRLHAQLKAVQQEIDDLKAERTKSPAAKPAADDAQIREMYGDDLADLLAQQRQEIADLRTALQGTTQKLSRVDELEQRTVQDAEQGVFDAIAEKHSDWQRINRMASFRLFLAEVDPATGEPRQDAIDRAMDRHDAKPIIHQLSEFKRRMKKSGNRALETQAVPADAGGSPPAPQPDTTVYSLAEIQKFQQKLALQASRGVPMSDEQKRLDTLYNRALAEGRAQ